MSDMDDAVNVSVKVDASGVQAGAQTAGQALNSGLTPATDKATQAINSASAANKRWLDSLQSTKPVTAGVSAEVLKLDNQLAQMMARLDPAYAAELRLANGTALLDANLAAGNISVAKHAEMLARLEGSMGGATTATKGFSFATAGASRELFVMSHEILMGNYSRIPGSLMVMTERAGGLGMAFAALLSPLGATALAFGGVIAAVALLTVKAQALRKEMDALQENFIATGRGSSFNEEQFQSLAEQLASTAGITQKTARTIIAEFERTRQLSGTQIETLTSIVRQFALATGTNMEQAAKALSKAFSDPKKGAEELDKEFNLLTASQRTLIEAQLRQGDATGAQSTMIAALRKRFADLNPEALRTLQIMEKLREVTEGMGHEVDEPAKTARNRTVVPMDPRQTEIKAALDESTKFIPIAEKRRNIADQILGIEKGIAAAKAVGDTQSVATLEARAKEAQRQSDALHLPKGPKAKKPPKPKGMATTMQNWRDELEEQEEAEGNYFEDDKAKELAFWEAKLAIVKKGTRDYVEVHRQVYQLSKALAKENLDAQIADIKANAAQYAQGSTERVKAAQDVAKLIGNAYGMESRQYKAAMREVEAAQRAHVQAMRQMAEQEITAKLQHAKTLNDIERDRLTFEVSIGQMTAEQRLTALKNLEAQEYQQELNAINAKLALQGVEPKERQQLNEQIEQLDLAHQRKMLQLNQQTVQLSQAKWTAFWQPIESASQSAFNGLLMRTMSWRQAFSGVLTGMLSSFENMLGEMVSQWIAKTAMMKTIKAAFGVADVASGAAEGAASAAPQIAAETANSAAVAVNTTAQGVLTASMAILAASVDANTAAVEMSSVTGGGGLLDLIPGFAVGAWSLPGDTLARVHEDEMIVPAGPAAQLREAFTSGGWTVPTSVFDTSSTTPAAVATSISNTSTSSTSSSSVTGGDTHVHLNVSAVDSQSVARFFRDNRGALAKQIKTSIRDHELRIPK